MPYSFVNTPKTKDNIFKSGTFWCREDNARDDCDTAVVFLDALIYLCYRRIVSSVSAGIISHLGVEVVI